jgi:20S proteasome subunit beta 3
MSNPFSINGGSIVALQGKDCVGIACDLRLGQQALTLSTDFPKIFPMGEKVFLGLSGLATDVQTLYSTPCDPLFFSGPCFYLLRLTLW